MNHVTKQSNYHKAHPTECETCGRKLPKRAFRRQCATCIKHAKFMAETYPAYKARFTA